MKSHISLGLFFVFANNYPKGGQFALADEDAPTCVDGFHGASYILFTRDIPTGKLINHDDKDIPLDKNARTAFSAHGFGDKANSSDNFDLATAWLSYAPMNIFSVQWDDDACAIGGSDETRMNYSHVAISYLPRLGKMVASFTERLMNEYDVELCETTLVGHSLGAHLVGYAAKAVQKRGLGSYKEIFGLDPAGNDVYPYLDCSQKLCITDAPFLAIFHTTTNPGTKDPFGDVDFYFNGGGYQPGCPDVLCSHIRARQYFTASIRNMLRCRFLGTHFDFRHNTTIPQSQCTRRTCTPAGLQTIRHRARGTFYVKTSDELPYCLD